MEFLDANSIAGVLRKRTSWPENGRIAFMIDLGDGRWRRIYTVMTKHPHPYVEKSGKRLFIDEQCMARIKELAAASGGA